MRRNSKNLSKCVQGTPSSTRAVQNSASEPFYSKGKFIQLKGQYNKLLRELSELRTPEHIYRVRLVFHYQSRSGCDLFEIDKHVQARSKEEAFGKVYSEMSERLPDFNLPLKSAGGVQLCTLIK